MCAVSHTGSGRMNPPTGHHAAAIIGEVNPPTKVALAQINPMTGDLDGNARKILDWVRTAAEAKAGLALFPELALTGPDCGDLFCRHDFLAASERVLEELARETSGVTALVGCPEPLGAGSAADTVAVLADGAVRGRYRKRILDRTAGLDQPARFTAGTATFSFGLGALTVGVLATGEYRSAGLVPEAGLLAVADASPYARGAGSRRELAVCGAAREHSAWIALAGPAGGQDELVYEGASTLVSPDGEVVCRAAQFSEELLIAEVGVPPAPRLGDIEELYAALVTGIRDYVRKNGFSRVGLGFSGGIDSALVAALAADAIGPDRVSGVVMPSRHSSEGTQSDAREMAQRLGCELLELPIEGPMKAYTDLLGTDSGGVAGENLQARIRGNLLMALSNSRGWLVLSTGNRSESAVGYATIYGDMAGGLAPIQDVPKTDVFDLCRYRNSIDPVIPESIIERPPSAELSPGQKDSDSLPEYDELDRILDLYLEQGAGAAEIVARGEDPRITAEVIALVDRSEHKRRQAAPGLRVSRSSFTRDRRMPLTSGYATGGPEPRAPAG